MPEAQEKVRVAILDDYQNVASSKFARLSDRIEIALFPETLNPKDAAQEAELIERLKPFPVISGMRERTPFTHELISSLPNLKYLLTTGTRNRGIDLEACAEHNIVVTGTKGSGPVSSAELTPGSTTQHTWALVLGIARHLAHDDAVIKAGGWQTSFAAGLPGQTLGILGLGSLGVAAAKIGVIAFGMKIKAWSTSLTQEIADEKAEKEGLPKGAFEVVSKEELFRASDVLSIHYVLSPRSVGIVGRAELELLKPTALLVNTSRGPLVDEDALLDTLERGKIAGAAIDVFSTEPLPSNSPWRTTRWGEGGRSEVLLSPHMGYVERPVFERWYEEQADNLERWLDGKQIENILTPLI
ncbi:hypothetical protein KEM56_000014 [Ascosphaera pollenicola]|nr:hypothetical protein KEM56_000014 [Ascosphaera pollenicola]